MEYPNPISLNRYAYVNGDPANFNDPSGLGFWANVWSVAKAFASTVSDFGQAMGGLGGPGKSAGAMAAADEGWGDRSSGDSGSGSDPVFSSTGYARAPCPPASPGFGFGVLAGASGEAGAMLAGASTQASVGAGAFVNGSLQPSIGVFASGGAAANAGSNVSGTPSQVPPTGVIGAFAGYGPGVFVTNAGSPQQLAGPFWTATANIGIGLGQASLSFGFSPGVFMVSATGGPVPISSGWGFSLSSITTNTAAWGTAGCP